MNRDYGMEIDALRMQLEELKQLIQQSTAERNPSRVPADFVKSQTHSLQPLQLSAGDNFGGTVHYSGQMGNAEMRVRWEPQERRLEELVGMNSEKAAKVLAALGHKQRLDILMEIMKEPLTGMELVERLNMGTTGQLYHHLKALTGADLLTQEERGGKYTLSNDRALPLVLLLAAVADVLETSDYIDMTHARNQAERYLGGMSEGSYDVHLLLWAVIENTILEHRAGYCSEMRLFMHDDGSVTVADNGRGIPVKALSQGDKPVVQTILTDMQSQGSGYVAPGGEKGISIAVVNALSQALTIEIRRDGKIYRQHYRNGIPLSGLQTVGTTSETGTSVTFTPSAELFHSSFNKDVLEQRKLELSASYPNLTVVIDDNSFSAEW